MKVCTACGVLHSLEFFHKDKRTKDGRASRCKNCRRTIERDRWQNYTEGRKEELREGMRTRRTNNLESERERERIKGKAYRKKNPHKIAEMCAKHRAAKRHATPQWADRNKIKEIYKKAHAEGNHVDHIVPLQSSLVCGLHCEANLQILSPLENRSKSNRFWPDMW